MGLQDLANAIQATSLSTALKNASWVVPAVQSVHILMVGVVFVSLLAIALRVLGRLRDDEPLPRVYARFAPFLWGGLLVMALTGALLVVAEPVREFMTLSFRLKMLLLVVGVTSAAAFGRRVRRAARDAGAGAGLTGSGMRFAAVVTVLLWLGILLLGRAIAYDDSVWGAWSPMHSPGGAST